MVSKLSGFSRIITIKIIGAASVFDSLFPFHHQPAVLLFLDHSAQLERDVIRDP
jgi:hypothetical protein